MDTTSALAIVKEGGVPLAIRGGCSIIPLTEIIECFMFYRKACGDIKIIITAIRQATFCDNWFSGRTERILMELEKGLSQLLVLLKSSVAPGATS